MSTTTIPQPQFTIGDAVFLARTEPRTKQLPCPDCLGQREWEVMSPAGKPMRAACPRCNGSYRSDIPPLVVREWAAYTRPLTIGSVRLDTNDIERPISYMCRETGVGSGSVYYEQELFETEEAARRYAESLAAKRSAAERERAEHWERQEFSRLTIREALAEDARRQVWRSGYRLAELREDLQRLLDEGGVTPDNLREVLDWERDHRPKHPLDRLLAVVAKVRPHVPAGDLLAQLDAAVDAVIVRAERGAA